MASPAKSSKSLVSACLAGTDCTFRGSNNLDDRVKKMADSGACECVCPEVLGGFGVPRRRIELTGGDGKDVLAGKARAIDEEGLDVTEMLISGCQAALKVALENNIKKAILKSNSPSCGAGMIYDGTFSGRLKKGDGVLTALLKSEHVEVITEKGL